MGLFQNDVSCPNIIVYGKCTLVNLSLQFWIKMAKKTHALIVCGSSLLFNETLSFQRSHNGKMQNNFE